MLFDEFLSIVDLIKNTAKYEAKIKELQDREAAINAAIDSLGAVKDIAKAKADAEALRAKAADMIDVATKKAEKILSDAGTAYNKRHADLQEREVKADQALADYNTIKNTQEARNNELRQQEKAVAAMQESLAKQQSELSAKQAEVEDRLAKLRQVMG